MNPRRVARAVMTMGVSAREFKGLKGEYHYPGDRKPVWKWRAHRGIVARQCLGNPKAYRARIETIVEEALRREARCLLLPACALTSGNRAGLLDLFKRFKSVPFVVAGTMLVGKPESDPLGWDEGGVVLRDGKVAADFDSSDVIGVLGPDFQIGCALSSTIKKFYEDGSWTRSGIGKGDGPLIIFDSGHHHYGGRYMKTLGAVWKRAERRSPGSAVVLSYRRHAASPGRSPWAAAGKSPVEYERMKIPYQGSRDYLDFFNL